MTKQKIDKNYLDYIPVKNPDIEYETNEKGTITVFIRWEGFFNKIAQKLMITEALSGASLMTKRIFTHFQKNSTKSSLTWKSPCPASLNS